MLKAEKERKGSTLIIRIGEELNAVNAPELQKMIDESVDDDVMEVIFDVSKVPYTSSSGLRVFLATQYMMEDRKGELKLIGVNEPVREVLEVSGLDSFMNYTTAE